MPTPPARRPTAAGGERLAPVDGAGDALGALLREWRRRRGLSQHRLALAAGVSQRHLSFVELGLARASRALVLRLGEHLDVPLRERNRLLLAAGFAPAYAEEWLDAPSLAAGREAVARVLAAQEPSPSLAVDRAWNELMTNGAVAPVLHAGVSPQLLREPVNVLRLTLHPDGLAPRIANLAAWRAGLLAYLDRQVAATGDAALGALLAELRGYGEPMPDGASEGASDGASSAAEWAGPFLPLQLRTAHGPLALLSTVTVFATPTAVVLAELLIETFLPADAASAERLRRIVDAARGGAAPTAAP